jgi:hypothetical protein
MLDAFKRLFALILDHEHSRHELMYRSGYNQRVGRRGGLHPRGHVRYVAKHVGSLAAAFTDNHGANVNSKPGGEPGTLLVRKAPVQSGHGLKDGQPGEHGAMRIVLMRLRVAKVDQQAVPEGLREVPVEAVDRCLGGAVITSHHFPPVLRIEMGCYPGGPYKIAEQDRQMAAFTLDVPSVR